MSDRETKNDLVAFAGPIFDLILRLKAGIVAPSNDLRPKVASMLEDFEKRRYFTACARAATARLR